MCTFLDNCWKPACSKDLLEIELVLNMASPSGMLRGIWAAACAAPSNCWLPGNIACWAPYTMKTCSISPPKYQWHARDDTVLREVIWIPLQGGKTARGSISDGNSIAGAHTEIPHAASIKVCRSLTASLPWLGMQA